jgi:hypothetical protein
MEFVHNIEPLETLGQKTLRANQTVKETHDFSVDHGMNTKYSLWHGQHSQINRQI